MKFSLTTITNTAFNIIIMTMGNVNLLGGICFDDERLSGADFFARKTGGLMIKR
jgi:hypothetical protein